MEVPIHPLEKWRHKNSKTQRQVAAEIYCADDVISRIEQGRPVRAKYIERLVALSEGRLRREDFTAVGPRRKTNGSKGEEAGRKHGKEGARKTPQARKRKR
jgi:transcriptional regulator with XRE-family HTH domain